MTITRVETSVGELYAGPMPDYLSLCELEKMGIDLIWNLAAELPKMADKEKYFVDTVLWGEIEDYSIPSDDEKFIRQLNSVVGLLKHGGKVFCHCVGGKGRSGLAVACIKIVLDGYSPDDALAFVKEMFGGPETEDQIDFVKSITVSNKGEVFRCR